MRRIVKKRSQEIFGFSFGEIDCKKVDTHCIMGFDTKIFFSRFDPKPESVFIATQKILFSNCWPGIGFCVLSLHRFCEEHIKV